MEIVVYTALFGDADQLWSPYSVAVDGCKHVCFSEKPRRQVGLWSASRQMLPGTGGMSSLPTWEVRIVPSVGSDSRYAARHYKTLPHRYLPEADVTIWVDANVRLLISPREAVRQWLKNGLFAAFKHPVRKCLYAEAHACLASPRSRRYRETLKNQIADYRKRGMPKNWGLAETRCTIRANTEKVNQLNEMWWEEIQQYSPRDQVSLPYVCWKLGLHWDIIAGKVKPPDDPRLAILDLPALLSYGAFVCIRHGQTIQ